MRKDFAALEARLPGLRMTKPEFLKVAGISPATYWRAANGKVKDAARVRTLRKAEAALAALENPCSLCGKAVAKPCGEFGCPVKERTN